MVSMDVNKSLKNSLKPRIPLGCTLEKSVTKISLFFARGAEAKKYTELPAENTIVNNANITSMILPISIHSFSPFTNHFRVFVTRGRHKCSIGLNR